jgi:hypothetical protein
MGDEESPHRQDEPEEHPKFRWPSIMSRERREMLVELLLFTRGVATIVGPPVGARRR